MIDQGTDDLVSQLKKLSKLIEKHNQIKRSTFFFEKFYCLPITLIEQEPDRLNSEVCIHLICIKTKQKD